MLEFICYSLIWIFALYGFIEIIKTLIYTFVKLPNNSSTKIHIIIGIKNAEEYIESFIRTLFFKTQNHKKSKNIDTIVVDMDSNDNTKKILENLKNDYNFELKNLEDIKLKTYKKF